MCVCYTHTFEHDMYDSLKTLSMTQRRDCRAWMHVSFAGQTLAESVGERSIRQRDQLLADQLLDALRQREILFDRVADLWNRQRTESSQPRASALETPIDATHKKATRGTSATRMTASKNFEMSMLWLLWSGFGSDCQLTCENRQLLAAEDSALRASNRCDPTRGAHQRLQQPSAPRGCESATSMKIRSMWDIGTSWCGTRHFFICIARVD